MLSRVTEEHKTFTRTEGHRFNQTNLSYKSLSLKMDSARACTQQLMFRASHEYGNLPGEEIKHSDFRFVSTPSRCLPATIFQLYLGIKEEVL